MDPAAPELKDCIGDRNLKNTREVGDVDKISSVPTITAVAVRRRNAATHGLNPFDLDNKLSRRDACHSRCPPRLC